MNTGASLPQQLPHGRLSALLTQLARREGPGRITIGDIVNAIGNRAFGALIFAFAAPIALPIPLPGISIILGVPLLLLTWQLMIGRRQPFLPAAILRQSLDGRSFSRLLGRLIPWLERCERVIGPRHLWVTSPSGERWIGSFGFVLSLTLLVPVPFANMLPGLALAVLAIGMLERDGRVILAGGFLGAVGISLLSGIAYGFIASALAIARNAAGT